MKQRVLLLQKMGQIGPLAANSRPLAGEVRGKRNRHKHATCGSIDSQSVKPGLRGYDANKKVKGRKRLLLVGTLGLIMKAKVTTADIQDRDGAQLLLKHLPGTAKCLRKIRVDAA